MSSLISRIETAVGDAFEKLGMDSEYGKIIVSNRPDLGQFQCNGALKAMQNYGIPSREIAQKLEVELKKSSLFSSVSLAGPGFINLKIHEDELSKYLNSLIEDFKLGIEDKKFPSKIVLDFGGPNIAKAMHVGHLRSAIVGDCLQRLFRFIGDQVTSDIHLGDWGLPMGMLISEIQHQKGKDVIFSDGNREDVISINELEEMYPAATNRCKTDPQAREEARHITAELQQGHPYYLSLWKQFRQTSIESMKKTFDTLGVNFDMWKGESSIQHLIPSLIDELKEKELLIESEGALVTYLEEEEDKSPIPPLILINSNSGITYGLTDLATIKDRTQSTHVDHIIYVVDKRQSLHFKQVFRAAMRCNLTIGAKLEHIGFGTLNGLDNKPFKTRDGGVMRLETLIEIVKESAMSCLKETSMEKNYTPQEQLEITDKVALAALKFADLSTPRESDYIFDPNKFTSFKGRTGPYLLYTAVRIKSILGKAEEQGMKGGIIMPPTDLERDLMLILIKFPLAINTAYSERAPHYLCDFVYELAQAFSRFYQSCNILKEEDKLKASSWISLINLTLRHIELVLSLLGISIPKRM